MRIITATRAMQGKRANDFCWADEGEPVIFGTECDGEAIDGPCGCRRSMSGMQTHKGTTTLMVRDLDITKTEMLNRAEEYIKNAWGDLADEDTVKAMRDEMKGLLELATKFKVNTVLEKRGHSLVTRGYVPEGTQQLVLQAGTDWINRKKAGQTT